jgi:tyrosine-protein phosphatase YwqE
MGFFNFFKPKPSSDVQVDLSQLAVDLHSHLIPGIDDGAKTLDDSIQLILELKALGFHKIITTPHIMSDYYRNTPEAINSGLYLLRTELLKRNIDIEIEAAAEYYYDEYFLELLKTDNLLTIHKEYLLFELSYLTKPSGIDEVIFKIQTKGLKPLLAHPERYPFLKMADYTKYKEAGCLFQLNILSLTGHYGEQAMNNATQLIELGYIDFLATDLHHMHHIHLIKKNALKNEKLLDLISFGSLKNRELL